MNIEELGRDAHGKPNEEKIYCRPLFLRGERLYVTRHDALWSHYVNHDVIGFNEILEKI
jgi:hypothetical protein